MRGGIFVAKIVARADASITVRLFDQESQRRSKSMRIRHTLSRLAVVAFALVRAGAAQVLGQDTPEMNRIANVEALKKFRRVVVKRDADWFTMAPTTGGPQTVVLLSSSTEVKSHKKGVFRGSKEDGWRYILGGLRLRVEG